MTSIDPLPSWHEGPKKQAILDFIHNVTDENSPHYVAVPARIAVFDNDGTLWCEKPKVTEIVFIADLFKHNPEQAIASGHSFFGGIFGKKIGDFLSRLRHFLAVTIKNILADGRWLLREVIDGISTDEYKQWAEHWLAQAQHPRFLRPYTELVYQPMLEVLQLFAQHGFKNYIVSGGSNYFVRAMCEPCYLIPPEQAIGSQLLTRVTDHDGQLQVEMRPIPWFFDNGAGKVLSIESRIDRHPIAAFGNSRGDIKMLRWASATTGALCMMVHHTDAEREYQYCPGNKVLEGASQYGWSMIDMKKDWREIFPAEKVSAETEK
ncbi:MAG: haloacid dehalogenase-like hydrolase [Gammaproteobacteria bacterium]|nr:haloacid dehalogenase-like hydrolase [Gammaproteobacteria bacterium]